MHNNYIRFKRRLIRKPLKSPGIIILVEVLGILCFQKNLILDAVFNAHTYTNRYENVNIHISIYLNESKHHILNNIFTDTVFNA
jgi:hypothetical protein